MKSIFLSDGERPGFYIKVFSNTEMHVFFKYERWFLLPIWKRILLLPEHLYHWIVVKRIGY